MLKPSPAVLAKLREKWRPTFGDQVDDPEFDLTDPFDTLTDQYKSLKEVANPRTATWMYNPKLEDKPKTEVIDSSLAMKIKARRMTTLVMSELRRIIETSKNDTARIKAMEMVLDRAWGKVTVEAQPQAKPATEIQVVWGEASGKKTGIQITNAEPDVELDDED